ncbi:hypothetical protein B0A55_08923 [Friedmanniomyces simplex]|uniref:DNA (cytosine-5-)-methyltransferase n=1 Tax=Friedmanniomyces simplex TaxID=329884 RepID=A0A4U0X3L1_9PEZI|nr:hypothetical protein B0A55_08923 [Friedmanniomyces simplex]
MAPLFKSTNGRSRSTTFDIDLCESSDDEDEPEIDLTGEDSDEEVQPDAGILPRGKAANMGLSVASPPPPGYHFVRSVVTSMGTKITLDPGQRDVELTDEDFVRVKRIMSHRNGEVLLRGTLFRRAYLMDRMLRKAPNEVCAILMDVDPSLENPALGDHLVDMPLQCVCIRRTIILTNMPFAGYYSHSARKWSDHSFRDDCMPVDIAKDDGVLCCRWKRIQYKGAAGERGHCGALLKLRQRETDLEKGIPDAALVYWWRKVEVTGKGPSALPNGVSVDLTFDSDEEHGEGRRAKRRSQAHSVRTVEKTIVEDVETVSTDAFGNKAVHHTKRSEVASETEFIRGLTPRSGPKRKLAASKSDGQTIAEFEALISEPRTHFDLLAGGGGATTGAEEAGSVITFLLDKSLDACKTLRLAFPRARILHKVLGDFLHARDGRSYQVITAHISYPCKTYSPAHTAEVGTCQHDYENEDSACSVNDIFKKTRPKIVTFEQTDAMVGYKKNYHVWRRLVRDITSAEYSVRWRIMDATEHGNASKRNRLIILTACPGHPLPDFPPPRPGPKTTIRQILARVGPLRDMEEHTRSHTIKDEPPYDDNTTLRYTITCGGGAGDLHPGGKRSFLIQELAMLAGFPRLRRFARASMTALREIIGNAVPVGLARDLYRMVHRGLDQGEKEMGRWSVEVGALSEEDVRRVRERRGPETIGLSVD